MKELLFADRNFVNEGKVQVFVTPTTELSYSIPFLTFPENAKKG
jgi:hypothetical protein